MPSPCQVPKVRISPDDQKLFFRDPHIITLEAVFAFLSVANVLVLHYMLSTVIPFPITVTWFQFLIALLYARVLGECGKEFPNLAFFMPLKIEMKHLLDLALPTCAFIGMIVFGNMLLGDIRSVAMFPVAAALSVFTHHISRFFGCGQIYRPIRWLALGLMILGFFVSCFDRFSLGNSLIFTAVAYSFFSATYRACFLERAMHQVLGLGNMLHNHQIFTGSLLLPLAILVTRERRFFTYMPTDFSRGHTWLMWGCLASAAMLPFMKNIVANRLIKLGGQTPWRAIELLSIVAIFLLGFLIFDRVSSLGTVAFLLVLGGRTLNSMDALEQEAMIEDAAVRARNAPPTLAKEGKHGQPLLSPRSEPPPPFHPGPKKQTPSGLQEVVAGDHPPQIPTQPRFARAVPDRPF